MGNGTAVGNREFLHQRNVTLVSLISAYFIIQITINSFIEGIASIFPPALLFAGFYLIVILLLHKKVNPKLTMYVLVSFMYIYFYFLLIDSPYFVNYLFMWLALPLSAIYQHLRVVIMAGVASVLLTMYSFFYLHDEIFPHVGTEDFVYLVLFGLFITTFLVIFVHKVRQANGKLQEIAYRDPLTGAANRLLLKEKFDLLKDTNVSSIGMLFIDLNGFKSVNDTYGHEVGDWLLEMVVSRVNQVLRGTDLLCRLGGDEFVVLLANINRSVPETVAKRVQLTLEEPMEWNEQRIPITASIGWSYTADVIQADLESLIREADQAMYKAKGIH
jgi:diguanylate cyclase (GGDEF)-like protein